MVVGVNRVEGGRRTGTSNMEEDWRGMQSVEGLLPGEVDEVCWEEGRGRSEGQGWREGKTERERERGTGEEC